MHPHGRGEEWRDHAGFLVASMVLRFPVAAVPGNAQCDTMSQHQARRRWVFSAAGGRIVHELSMTPALARSS